ncbi:MAG: PQQ-binding-like beta-propeller repeat protein [Planctomycetes bacterium]|nr:PQQ-binding-like beta-propeller repeat protein [Planctomycetota bacterium]
MTRTPKPDASACRLICVIAASIAATLLVLVSPIAAQPNLERRFRQSVALETSSAVVKKLSAAGEYLSDRQWKEGFDILQEVAATQGDTLVELEPGRYVNAARYGQLLIAALPAEGLAAYRRQVDGAALRWLQEGRLRRDPRPLVRVVEEAFASSHGDEALWLLAQWAWDRGELAQARGYWTQLVPLENEAAPAPGTTHPVLRYPDADFPQPDVLARLVLASLMEGDLAQAGEELGVLRARFPDAQGELAGHRGGLAEILETLLAEARGWSFPAQRASVSTFAVNAQRNGIVPQTVDVGAKLWSVELPPSPWPLPVHRAALARDDPLRLHPVVFGDMVLLNDGERVYAWKLSAQQPTPYWEDFGAVIYPEGGLAEPSKVTQTAFGVPQHTTTVYRGRLYARMGSLLTGVRKGEIIQHSSRIVCLDLSEQTRGKPLWEVHADVLVPEERGWAFEGTPVVDGGRLYAALRQSHPDARLRVACLDAETGAPLWMRYVCSAVYDLGAGRDYMSHLLLTLGEGLAFLSTDLGAVAALDTEDGSIRWIVTYESKRPASIAEASEHLKQGLLPCLYTSGRVIAAPNDSERILSIDAETGLVQWEQKLPDRIRYLLGVGQGRVIVSGDSVWGLDLETGDVRPPRGWGQPAQRDPQFAGYGRGLLAGDVVLWPTRERIHVLDQATGQAVRAPIELADHPRLETGGNLAIAGNHLLVAQANRLVVFSDTGGLIERKRRVVRTLPNSPHARVELAEALASAGRLEEAVREYHSALRLESENGGDSAAAARSQTRLFELLVRLGRRALDERDPATAAARLQEAVAAAPDAQSRLKATWTLAEAQRAHGKHAEAVAAYQSILSSVSDLPPLTKGGPGGVAPGTTDPDAHSRARDEIARLIAEHGRDVYARFEARAAQRLDEALKADDPAAVRRVLEEYPNAAAHEAAQLELARLYRRRGDVFAALETADRLLSETQTRALTREAHLLRARTLEDRGYLQAAAQAWSRAAAADPTAPVSISGGERSLADAVRDKLSRDPYRSALPAGDDREPPLPLQRLWVHAVSSLDAPLFPVGTPPAADARLVLVNDDGLHAFGAADGSTRWSLATDQPVIWAGYLDAALVLGTRRGLRAVELESGRTLWEQRMPSARESPASTRLDSGGHGGTVVRCGMTSALPRAEVGGTTEDGTARRLVHFNPHAGVTACDDFGRIIWSYKRPAANFDAHWCCASGRILLRDANSGRLIVLAAGDGAELSVQTGGGEPWLEDPVPIGGERFAFVSGGGRRISSAVAEGSAKDGWTYAGAASHANADPTLVSDGERLLAIMDGDTLLRIDADTGNSLWSRRLSRRPVKASRPLVHLAHGTLYAALDGVLEAIDADEGGLHWRRVLGPAGENFYVRRTGDYILAWPAKPDGHAFVTILRAAGGEPVQELQFDSANSRLMVQPHWRTSIVCADERLYGLGRFVP